MFFLGQAKCFDPQFFCQCMYRSWKWISIVFQDKTLLKRYIYIHKALHLVRCILLKKSFNVDRLYIHVKKNRATSCHLKEKYFFNIIIFINSNVKRDFSFIWVNFTVTSKNIIWSQLIVLVLKVFISGLFEFVVSQF